MIEVENDDVSFATVDARMSAQVVADEWTVLFAIAPNSCDLLAYVCVTVTTARLPCALRLVVERERANGFEPPAVVAPLRC